MKKIKKWKANTVAQVKLTHTNDKKQQKNDAGGI